MQLSLRMMKSFLKVIFLLVLTTSIKAQELRFGLQPIQYVSESQGPYVDFYSTLDASTIAFEMDADSIGMHDLRWLCPSRARWMWFDLNIPVKILPLVRL